MRAEYTLTEERLITTEGTVAPQGVRFENGNILVCYHVGGDAYFSPCGTHISKDNGQTWQRTGRPLHRVSCEGAIGQGRALWFDQYVWRTEKDEYAAFYNETRDSGETFTGVKLARFRLEGAIDWKYVPRSHEDPDYFFEPDVPEFYHSVTAKHGALIGAYLFGTVLRLPDGALGLSAYAKMAGNMTRETQRSSYVAPRRNDGTAPEAKEEVLDSSLFFRSEDEGATWHCAGTIGKVRPGRPFDAGQLYSEGLNETGMACTTERKIFALMRHGSNMLLWYALSEDGGRTWSDIMPMNFPGVAPSMTLMPNGVLAAAWGRPGMTVGFSLDGAGRNWDLLVGILPAAAKSQGYPWLLPVDKNRVMILYDRRKWDPKQRRFYDHGIYCREITVDRK